MDEGRGCEHAAAKRTAESSDPGKPAGRLLAHAADLWARVSIAADGQQRGQAPAYDFAGEASLGHAGEDGESSVR